MPPNCFTAAAMCHCYSASILADTEQHDTPSNALWFLVAFFILKNNICNVVQLILLYLLKPPFIVHAGCVILSKNFDQSLWQ